MKLTAEELRWRGERVDAVNGDVLTNATTALLDLTYHEMDREWLQRFLLSLTSIDSNPQIRSLAVTCLGHVARLDGTVGEGVRIELEKLTSDPDLAGIAEDALGDILDYVDRKSQSNGDAM